MRLFLDNHANGDTSPAGLRACMCASSRTLDVRFSNPSTSALGREYAFTVWQSCH